MRIPFALLTGVLLVGVVVSSAGAGFIVGTIDVGLPSGPGQHHHGPPPWAGPPDWVFEKLPEQARLRLTEVFEGLDAWPVMVSGRTNADPVMHISKDVENSSGIIWTGYEVALEDAGAEFVGDATSSHFGPGIVTPTLITYTAPDAVPPGEIVTLDFDISISTIGLFAFTMTQTPVPEPATLTLLGLGGLGLAVMRRRRVR